MQSALTLARRNLGQTWPNPSVGAVIVKDGRVVGQGWTSRGGRPHAETQAIAQAGDDARGATMYVTLEPCAHHGKTGPCSEAIIKAGIARVVTACKDPNPLVAGKGIAQLQQAGIEVQQDVCRLQAEEINRGFFSVIEKKHPFISVKLATSLDGKIATRSGQSQWITGEEARRYGHMLRSRYDAIATGMGTVKADDPLLTCRVAGLEDKSPVRVVFDSNSELNAQTQLVRTANETPVWHMTAGKSELPNVKALHCNTKNNVIDLHEAVELLAREGITRLLIEAGRTLSTAFLQAGLVDRIYWFRAPMAIGEDGLSAVAGGFAAEIASLKQWKPVEQLTLGTDQLEVLECLPA